MAVTAALLSSCGGAKTTTAEADKFDYTVEQFADLQILIRQIKRCWRNGNAYICNSF